MKLKDRLQERIRSAVQTGFNWVEERHLQIAATPFSILKKFAGGPAKRADQATQRKIGEIYDGIRHFNKSKRRSATKPGGRPNTPIAAIAMRKAKAAGLAKASVQKGAGNSQHAAT